MKKLKLILCLGALLTSFSVFAQQEPEVAAEPEVVAEPQETAETAQPNTPNLAQQNLRLKEEFKKALISTRSRLHLSNAEARIFDREALPAADSFVDTYSGEESTDGQLRVQINEQKLVQFLKFNSTNKVCLKFNPKPSCRNCSEWLPAFSNGFVRDLTTRGMRVLITDDINLAQSLSGEESFEDYLARTIEKACEVSILAEVSGVRPENRKIDFMVHARKAHFDYSTQAMFDSSNMDAFAHRAAVGLFTGWQDNRVKVATEEQVSDRYLVLNHVDGFMKLINFKTLMSGAMPDVRIEERVISPGRFVFQVKSTRALSEIANELVKKGMLVARVTESEIQVSLQ